VHTIALRAADHLVPLCTAISSFFSSSIDSSSSNSSMASSAAMRSHDELARFIDCRLQAGLPSVQSYASFAAAPPDLGTSPPRGCVVYTNTQPKGARAPKRLALGTPRPVGPSAGFVVRRLPSGGRDVQTGVRGTLAHLTSQIPAKRTPMRTKTRGMPHQGYCWPINAPFYKTECRSILRFTPSSQSMSQEMRRLSA
jgi:hypothetical protein